MPNFKSSSSKNIWPFKRLYSRIWCVKVWIWKFYTFQYVLIDKLRNPERLNCVGIGCRDATIISFRRVLHLICQSAFPHKLHLYIVQFQMLIIQKCLTLQTAIQPKQVCKCIHLKVLSCSLCIGWQIEQSRTFELCRNWLQRRCNFLLSSSRRNLHIIRQSSSPHKLHL